MTAALRPLLLLFFATCTLPTRADSTTAPTCPFRFFGPNCTNNCHCYDDNGCDSATGACDEALCDRGWRNPPLCQTECPSGTFGLLCLDKCHCQNVSLCDKVNGVCLDGICEANYTSYSCQKRRPSVERSPEVVFVGCDEFALALSQWNPPSDPGDLPAYAYRIEALQNGTWTEIRSVLHQSGSPNIFRPQQIIFFSSAYWPDNFTLPRGLPFKIRVQVIAIDDNRKIVPGGLYGPQITVTLPDCRSTLLTTTAGFTNASINSTSIMPSTMSLITIVNSTTVVPSTASTPVTTTEYHTTTPEPINCTVTSLDALSQSGQSILIMWTLGCELNSATLQRIQLLLGMTSSSNDTRSTALHPADRSYVLRNLSAETTYRITVLPIVDGQLLGNNAATVTIVTPAALPTPPTLSLRSVDVTNASVELSGSGGSAGRIVGWEVRYSYPPSTAVMFVEAAAAQVDLEQLRPYAVVKAEARWATAAGWSTWSEPLLVRTLLPQPPAVQQLRLADHNDTCATFLWTADSQFVDYVNITLNLITSAYSPSQSTTSIERGASMQQLSACGLMPASVYVLSLSQMDAQNRSSAPTTLSFGTALPAALSNGQLGLSALNVTAGDFLLAASLNASDTFVRSFGIVYYEVFRSEHLPTSCFWQEPLDTASYQRVFDVAARCPLLNLSSDSVFVAKALLNATFAPVPITLLLSNNITVQTLPVPSTSTMAAILMTPSFQWWWIVIVALLLLILAVLATCLLVRYLPRSRKRVQSHVDGAALSFANTYWTQTLNPYQCRSVDLIGSFCKLNAVNAAEEYSNLKRVPDHTQLDANDRLNQIYNRSQHLLPYDYCRVKLKPQPPASGVATDYFNASLIRYDSDDYQYIASQSPFDERTAAQFLQMIIDYDVRNVVMVTDIKDGATLKCYAYWSDEQVLRIQEQFVVEVTSVTYYAKWTHRQLRIGRVKDDGQSADWCEIEQFQFVAWPEHSRFAFNAKLCVTAFCDFHLYVGAHTGGASAKAPLLVHCGTGYSRTSVYVAYDILVNTLLTKPEVSVWTVVNQLRDQRHGMVRSLHQYCFLYCAVFEYASALHACSRLAFVSRSACERSAWLRNDVHKLFDLVKRFCVLPVAADFVSANNERNSAKNRFPTILAAEHCRCYLQSHGGDYINAVAVETYRRQRLVVTQTPLPHTVSDFWNLVYEEQITTILSLEDFGKDDAAVFWEFSNVDVQQELNKLHFNIKRQPANGEASVLQIEENGRPLTWRYFSLEKQTQAHPVRQLTYAKWTPSKRCFPNAQEILRLVHVLSSPNERVLVHCYDGALRSGLLCAAVSLYQKLISVPDDAKISILWTVKALKRLRPQFIGDIEQFKWCFKYVRFLMRQRLLIAD